MSILKLINKIKNKNKLSSNDLEDLQLKGYWKSMDYFRFEEEICRLLQLHHEIKATTTKKTRDNGIDIIFDWRNKKGIVQCKQYNSKINVKTVRELYGVMTKYDYDIGVIVTTSYFTKECIKFKEGLNIELRNIDDIIRICRESNFEIKI